MFIINKTFLFASIILFIGSVTAAISHWIAHSEQDFRFTILGFISAVFSGMFYGISVESRKLPVNQNKTVAN